MKASGVICARPAASVIVSANGPSMTTSRRRTGFAKVLLRSAADEVWRVLRKGKDRHAAALSAYSCSRTRTATLRK